MAINVDSHYALNFGLSGLPVDAEFPASALPEQRSIPPTGMPFVGEVDKLLAANGTASRIDEWVTPQTVSPDVLGSTGFNDALESVQRRLAERSAADSRDLPPESAAVLRRLAREVNLQISMRSLARENQNLLLAG